jgi:hypothetical protein
VAEARCSRRKTQLSDLVKRAPVALIVALKPVKERVFDLFHDPISIYLPTSTNIQNNLPLLSTDPRFDVFGVRRLKKPRR